MLSTCFVLFAVRYVSANPPNCGDCGDLRLYPKQLGKSKMRALKQSGFYDCKGITWEASTRKHKQCWSPCEEQDDAWTAMTCQSADGLSDDSAIIAKSEGCSNGRVRKLCSAQAPKDIINECCGGGVPDPDCPTQAGQEYSNMGM